MFNVENLNQNKFIADNNVLEVTNPIIFYKSGIPDNDGLLSDRIFGITGKERLTKFGYIDLYAKFIHPIVYKALVKLDRNITSVIAGTNTFSINPQGKLIEDEKGKTGLEWLITNIGKLKFSDNKSDSRKILIDSVNKYKNQRMFMDKFIVIPAGFRDIDTSKSFISIGAINTQYTALLRLAITLKTAQDYDESLVHNIKFKMQETMLSIVEYFLDGDEINGAGDAIRGKGGVINRVNLRKVVAHGNSAVLSQSDPSAEHWSELDCDMDTQVVTLPALVAQLFPKVLFNLKNLIRDMTADGTITTIFSKSKNKEISYQLKGNDEYYTEEKIQKMLSKFVKMNDNRFQSFQVFVDDNGKQKKLTKTTEFKIYDKKGNVIETHYRPLTICDLIFIAAFESSRDMCTRSSRYPIDTAFNQFVTKIKLGSTYETEIVSFRLTDSGISRKYDRYPKIRRDLVNTNTNNSFKETANITNSLLGSINGDFDGDKIYNMTPFSKEAQEELRKFITSKRGSIGLDGKLKYDISKETILTLYSLTRIKGEKLTDPVF